MKKESKYPYVEEGKRLRWLRLAERIYSGKALAEKLGWQQPLVSQFETGLRRMPRDKVLDLSKAIPGFSAMWLWEGDKTGLSFDLRKRIEEVEAAESAASHSKSSRRKA